jgi:hypothetical protein
MAWGRTGAVLGLVGIGVILAWPWLRAQWRLDPHPATILDVLVSDAGNGEGQVHVYYAWQVPGTDAVESHAGYRLGSALIRPITDPKRPRAEADALARSLLEQAQGSGHIVWVEPGRPDTSFLVTPVIAGAPHRRDLGLALVVAGLVVLLARRHYA